MDVEHKVNAVTLKLQTTLHMCKLIYLQIVIGAVLLILVSCGLVLIYNNDEQQLFLPPGEVNLVDKQQQPKSPPSIETKFIDKQQQINPSPEHSNEQHQHMPHDNITAFKHLVSLSNSMGGFKHYVDNLSPSQMEYAVRQFGINSLTSRTAQVRFLKCAGFRLLQRFKGKQPSSTIQIPMGCQRCKNMSFQSSGPVVALASFPGSGNSWVRELLESATGIYTGAVYCDLEYVNKGMIGEFVVTNNVIAVKVHFYKPSGVKKVMNNDKAIFIIRSPFEAILAEHNRVLGHGSHTIEANFKYANNSAWIAKVKKQSHGWRMYVMPWLNCTEYPVLIVGYENLKKDTYTELKRMLDFIGYPYTEEDILCAVKSGETFHRKHTKDIHPYSPKLEEFVLNEIKQIDANLLKHNISLYHPYNEN